MEESIGYEALFSSDEWDSLDTTEWSDIDDDFSDLKLSSGVVADGSGSAALPAQAAPDGVLDVPSHDTRIRQVVDELSSEERYEIVCAVCESIGDADSPDEAEAIANLHERFVAVLVDTWGIER